MNVQASQTHRIAELTTPLGKDKLLLSSFHAHEELARPFEINISCVSQEGLVDFGSVLGKNCVIRFLTTGNKKRYFSGVLAEARWKGMRDRGCDYDLVLRPWFWLLKHTSDSRIFQNKSIPDIIKDVFTKTGFNDFKFDLRETYQPVEYCVQYRESHFDFVSRLMEQHGIYYYFKHTDTKHDMVLADKKASHAAVPDLPTCEYLGRADHTRQDDEYLYEWMSGRAFRTGKVTVNAFDYKKPNASLKETQTSAGGYAHDQLEQRVYPHKFKAGQESDLGKKYAEAWLYSAQSEDKRRMATGDAASLFPGGLVKVTKHPVPSENIEYLVVAASHSFHGEMFTSGSGGEGGVSYHGEFLFQPSDRPFKAALLTPMPIIAGPQTAVVVGPAGEEIYTDSKGDGRVKVQFHWDRDGKKNENSSRWVRVAQMWAGKGWGSIFLPRIGMEVVVEFLEGDPDRPLIVGCVYNGENRPPFTLPDNNTISGVKSRSSKGGHTGTYNEFVFEDKKDDEYIRLHAEKNLHVTVENIENRLVQGRTLTGPGKSARVTTIDVGDDQYHVANGDGLTKVSRDVVEHIGRDQSTKIDQHQTTKVGENVLIDAGTRITFKVGGSTIEITEAGIKLQTNGYVKSSANIHDMKSSMKFSIKGPKIEKN